MNIFLTPVLARGVDGSRLGDAGLEIGGLLRGHDLIARQAGRLTSRDIYPTDGP
jgi:hypothetical protein